MDSLIDPSGWSVWSGDFALSTLYYAEFNNTGPGSNTSNRVTWPGYHVINATDAFNFTVSNFIEGQFWLPATGVPFDAGLLCKSYILLIYNNDMERLYRTLTSKEIASQIERACMSNIIN
ncbi:hypothetical protein SLE2022_125820 [Rubroshorea leprosula]